MLKRIMLMIKVLFCMLLNCHTNFRLELLIGIIEIVDVNSFECILKSSKTFLLNFVFISNIFVKILIDIVLYCLSKFIMVIVV